MGLHKAYLEAFRGGHPPHPVHPRSRAWDEQYVEDATEMAVFKAGRLATTGETVVASIGSRHWYRPGDLARLYDHGAAAYKSMAATIRALWPENTP